MAAGDERRKRAVVLSRVRRVQRRLEVERALKAAVAPMWCAVTALAAWRLVAQHHVAAVGACVFAAALVAWWLLLRGHRITEGQAAVIADRRAEAGGLLLTRLELPVGEWELELNQRVRQVTPPPIEARRPVGLLLLAACAGLIAFIVPLPPKTSRPVSSAAATRVDELVEKLDAVAREEPTDDAIAKELERLKEEVEDGTFDSADWEAADTLNAALDRQAAEAQAELSRSEAAAKSLEDAMKDAQGGEGATREREELEQALMAMADGQAQSGEQALQQAMKEQAGQGQEKGQEQGQQSGQQQGQNGQQQNGQPQGPSRSQVSDLRKALQQRQQQLSQQFNPGGQRQRQASRPQPGSGQQQSGQKQSGQGRQSGQGEGEGQKGEGQSGTGDAHASHVKDPGTGHGYSPPQDLVFGGEANIDPDRLKFEPLPQGQGGEGEDLFGLRAANPKKGEAPVMHGGSGAASGVQARGNDDGNLLPRNRVLIKRYFDSQ